MVIFVPCLQAMTKAYKVAGHVFHLEIPVGNSIAGMLSQYEPFVTEPSADPLFTLETVDRLPCGGEEKVYDVKTEPGEPKIVLYRNGERWYSEMAVTSERPVCARMLAEKDFRRAMVQVEKGRDALFGINNALMLLFAFSTAGLGTLEMHASVVCHDSKAYLFLGKSGTGKSTHSSLWLKYIEGTHLVNDDNPIVRVMEDGSVRVFGSPWSGKTPCYKNEDWPVGAFVRIRQSPENKISRLSVVESYASLYSSCSGFKADRSMADGLHRTLESVVLSVPCHVLDCRPDEEAARVCFAEVTRK